MKAYGAERTVFRRGRKPCPCCQFCSDEVVGMRPSETKERICKQAKKKARRQGKEEIKRQLNGNQSE